jgi:uncharacterized protein YebE (UPF0316 family)
VLILTYLGLGILSDLLVTGYTLSASRGRTVTASVLSFVIALLNFYILGKILILDPSLWNALAYAGGNAIGCFAIMKASRR